MVNIVLPSNDPVALKYVQHELDTVHNIYIVFDSFVDSRIRNPEHEYNVYFTRLSAQVYVQISDFEILGKLVLEILDCFLGSALPPRLS